MQNRKADELFVGLFQLKLDTRTASPHRLLHFGNPIRTLQEFPWLRTICRSDDSVTLHQIDEMRGASITNPQATLQQRSRRFTKLENQTNCVFVQLIMSLFTRISCSAFNLSVLILRSFKERLLILRCALRLPEFDDGMNLLLRYERSMQAQHA